MAMVKCLDYVLKVYKNVDELDIKVFPLVNYI